MKYFRRLFLFASCVVAPAALYLACDDTEETGDVPTLDAGGDAGDVTPPVDGASLVDGGADTGTKGPPVRGPVSMAFDPAGNGDPLSMVWDDATSILYIADNRNNQIWSWTDAAGFAKLAKVPADPVADDAGRTNLGQIVKLPDGTLVVPRFGFGTVSALLYVKPATGESGTVPGLSGTRKRTALAVDPSGKLWGGYFFTPGDGLGMVNQYTLTGETDYARGFEKPVGTLVQDGRLLVSDQQRGTIYSLPLDGGFVDGGPYEVFAAVPSCDALTAGPSGSVITGQFRPLSDGGGLHLRQAFPDGGVRGVHDEVELAKPQGVAYDKTNKRLFVADSNGTVVRTIKILPID